MVYLYYGLVHGSKETCNIHTQNIGESQVTMLIERNQTQKVIYELILVNYANEKF